MCPYYGARLAVPEADIILAPYRCGWGVADTLLTRYQSHSCHLGAGGGPPRPRRSRMGGPCKAPPPASAAPRAMPRPQRPHTAPLPRAAAPRSPPAGGPTCDNGIRNGTRPLPPTPPPRHCSALLSSDARAALGLDPEGSVLVFDEAHNLLDAVNGAHSSSVTGEGCVWGRGAMGACRCVRVSRLGGGEAALGGAGGVCGGEGQGGSGR